MTVSWNTVQLVVRPEGKRQADLLGRVELFGRKQSPPLPVYPFARGYENQDTRSEFIPTLAEIVGLKPDLQGYGEARVEGMILRPTYKRGTWFAAWNPSRA